MKRIIFYISLSLVIIFLCVITYATLSPGYMKIRDDAPLESLRGRLIRNPIYSQNERGPEVYCHDNRFATHLLIISQEIEMINGKVPTYLDEIWNKYGGASQSIIEKNVLPLFVEKNLSNFWGLLDAKELYKYENQDIEIKGIRIVEQASNQERTFWQCQTFVVSEVVELFQKQLN